MFAYVSSQLARINHVRGTWRLLVAGAMLLVPVAGLGAASLLRAPPTRYEVRNLVSDQPGRADVTDPNLVNAWGIVPNPTGPWWVSDNGTGLSTLYNEHGAINSLVVTIPGGRPTGIVFNSGTDFVVHNGAASGPSAFIFANEAGIISGWSPAVPPPPPSHQAQVAVPDEGKGAIYKGLALASTASGDRLYTTDFHNGSVEVYDNTFAEIETDGEFEDDDLPAGFAPFGIAAINGKIYVSYAMQDADAEDDVAGKGLGYVNVFDTDGHLLRRLISRGRLNAPWGMVLAPGNFGDFSGDLLVGNFGDGRINAYDPDTGDYHGTLKQPRGGFVEIEGLWGLAFGNGFAAGPTNVLFFSAGPDDEEHGLFGSITATTPGHSH